ncbi:hypothetical protein D3C72_1035720 [compost metagenome]
MRQRLILSSLVLSGLMLPACGGEAPGTAQAPVEAAPAQAVAVAPAAIPDPAPAEAAPTTAPAPTATPTVKPPGGSAGGGHQPYAAPDQLSQSAGVSTPPPASPGGNTSVDMKEAGGGTLSVRLVAPGASGRIVRYEGALCLQDAQLGYFKVAAGPSGEAQVSFSRLGPASAYHLRVKAFDTAGRTINLGSPAYNAFGPLPVAAGSSTSAGITVPLQ